MLNKKYIKLFIIILASIFIFTIFSIYVLLQQNTVKNNSSEYISEEVSSVSDDLSVQAEVIYYDKSWYNNTIVNYSDVILPYNSENQSYTSETVFVGDSNTEGLALFEHLAYNNVIGKHSMPIQGVTSDDYLLVNEDNPETEEDESQYITMLQVIANKQPKRIIINFGTNNAGKGASADYFVNIYTDVLTKIEAVCPNTDIVVASILPVCLERDNLNIRQDIIDRFNVQLAELCRTHNYVFLNYTEVFKDPETGYANTEYFSVDGIHLNGNGYRLLLDYAANHQYNINN